MCKLNILCHQKDGECRCNQPKSAFVSNPKPQNGLLCAILSFIKTQPEIMKSLTETSCEHKVEDSLQSVLTTVSLNLGDHSPTQNSSQEGVADYSVNLISDLPSKFIVGRGFPLMVETVDRSSHRMPGEDNLLYQVAIVDRETNKDLELLGEISITGVALFRKLVIQAPHKSAALVIRVKDREDINPLSLEIRIRGKNSCKVPNKACLA